MILRMPEPEIIKEKPFINDKLNREESAIILTQLFSNIEGPFVMSLNSPWGTGKTTFIKMFRQHLLNEGFPAIYFNAWETDYQDNPLMTFITEITISIKALEKDGFDITTIKDLRKKVFNTGKIIVKKVLPTAIKIATQGLVDLDKDFENIENSLADFTSDVTKEVLNNCADTKKIVEEFKKQLKELIASLQKNTVTTEEKKKPLVFFIDELDRCRPDYAIQVLEKIKHFFDIDGIIFVLGIDMKQLSNAVKIVYGHGEDNIQGYLKRFIDLEYNLPTESTTIDQYCKFLAYNTHITSAINQTKENRNSIEQLYETTYIFAYSYDLSLREINQLFINAYLLFLTYGENLQAHHVSLIIILLSIRIKNPVLFKQILDQKISVLELLERLHADITDYPNTGRYNEMYFLIRLRLLSLKKLPKNQSEIIIARLLANYYSSINTEQFKEIYSDDKHEFFENKQFTSILLKKITQLDSFKNFE